ncbi:hypothetical protein QIH87_47625 [Bradyrhizobium elkanii]|nr:hypothetical protein [Bradyrhizobium elkanii]WLB14521.1 hypothetical protein QIH87_47625 [Bradyrhizobium elkanii]WLB76988.1 hypothetical protein QIH89_00695 [Bradyrhizobium elkanii]
MSDTAFSFQSLSLPVLVDESFSAFSCPAKLQKPSLPGIDWFALRFEFLRASSRLP